LSHYDTKDYILLQGTDSTGTENGAGELKIIGHSCCPGIGQSLCQSPIEIFITKQTFVVVVVMF
jgi:hypothetical protein